MPSHLPCPETPSPGYRWSWCHRSATVSPQEPYYVRCIKPNDHKSPTLFDAERCRHQVSYLGLLENVRVRRAGFAYRQPYHRFLLRYAARMPPGPPKCPCGPSRCSIPQVQDDLRVHVAQPPDGQ